MTTNEFISSQTGIAMPAPAWFILLFKWLGMTLHMTVMSLILAGLGAVLVFLRSPNINFVNIGQRLVSRIPIMFALAINFGIVPLLFIQVGFNKLFYPTTILIAWAWLAIIPLLTLSYYGTYYLSYNSKKTRPSTGTLIIGCCSWLALVMIGLIFISEMSLMSHPHAWEKLFNNTFMSGAVSGLAFYLAPGHLVRFFLIFGLGLLNLAVFISLELFFQSKDQTSSSESYKIISKLAIFGLLIFSLAGIWYFSAVWSQEEKSAMLRYPAVVLTIGSFVFPVLTVVFLYNLAKTTAKEKLKHLVIYSALTQFIAVAINAASRQYLQLFQVKQFYSIQAQSVNTQIVPLLIFLILFIFGVFVIWWMISKIIRCPQTSPYQT